MAELIPVEFEFGQGTHPQQRAPSVLVPRVVQRLQLVHGEAQHGQLVERRVAKRQRDKLIVVEPQLRQAGQFLDVRRDREPVSREVEEGQVRERRHRRGEVAEIVARDVEDGERRQAPHTGGHRADEIVLQRQLLEPLHVAQLLWQPPQEVVVEQHQPPAHVDTLLGQVPQRHVAEALRKLLGRCIVGFLVRLLDLDELGDIAGAPPNVLVGAEIPLHLLEHRRRVRVLQASPAELKHPHPPDQDLVSPVPLGLGPPHLHPVCRDAGRHIGTVERP
mmetsp:Transcript_33518/g.81688  ORF Transcript_33518/g.81688 Transcript_33518/m.81688 type:complete len:276 (-) Transcript_33518:222-1049(-)